MAESHSGVFQVTEIQFLADDQYFGDRWRVVVKRWGDASYGYGPTLEAAVMSGVHNLSQLQEAKRG